MSDFKHYSWSALDTSGTQVLSFVGNILIARQLSPDDYGLIAMLAISMAIAWNFTESGLAIGNNVWIGTGVIILDGVTIGDNVVIGAGSVVTRNILDNLVYVGNPARKLRSL